MSTTTQTRRHPCVFHKEIDSTSPVQKSPTLLQKTAPSTHAFSPVSYSILSITPSPGPESPRFVRDDFVGISLHRTRFHHLYKLLRVEPRGHTLHQTTFTSNQRRPQTRQFKQALLDLRYSAPGTVSKHEQFHFASSFITLSSNAKSHNSLTPIISL